LSHPYIIHWMQADKFTLPLMEQLNKVYGASRHHFILLGETKHVIEPSVGTVLKTPFSKYGVKNLLKSWQKFKKADIVLLHGLPALHYLLLSPMIYKKLAWVIYGGTDLYLYSGNTLNFKTVWFNKMRRFILKRVKWHLTHIKGDSDLANQLYDSKAQFFYHPVYLSNVIDSSKKSSLTASTLTQKKHYSILVGHSTDPSNHHIEIFSWLKDLTNITIYCPLSYGPYEIYKEDVKKVGFQLFEDRFVPIEHFMKLEEYRNFLDSIDIAVFNHKRQEAMGVTLTLLSLGKVVFMNTETTSFSSFKERGFQIFDNKELGEKNIDFTNRDVSQNKLLLEKYYGLDLWEKRWNLFYQLS
jgi:dTDP-N-acetylfucosamine:lipid II N-acetylfucosaminyltransferase